MSVTNFDPNAEAVTMTETALRHFERALDGAGDKLVRLSTKESGCTGYAYVLDLVDASEPDDVVLHPNDKVTLAVAPDAVTILRGTEIDYVNEGVNSVVKFNNPNVVAECGCGESFSIA
ncbi:HesB/IscA family protein [Oceanicoccus sagamiensis]|uniref:Iron-sulfur cluster assembly accessory protein n=1 Tax=Oceanicoccus sagamiensis TaxID=716816 RepID=A0A1X9NI22_9GAMM|nr:iron-sulfur cluster assembly accessory protein [Oceanicoccus sagamiensis]ARN76042.1 iron-sulfur cluster assembly accessory protein [Oceanicoccus sagamiensis]